MISDVNDRPKSTEGHISRQIRTAIVGTGYIAEFHARGIRAAEGVDLVSVCDTNLKAAQSFADTWGVRNAFASIEAMLESEKLDAVHILVPPDMHRPVAKLALQSGVHVFIEKPMCPMVEECNELLDLAQTGKLQVGVNHNMLFAGAYKRLREAVHAGILGPTDHITFNHFMELGQIRLGPFDSWMLREPANVLREIGPHILSALIDLVGMPDSISAVADRESALPGGGKAYRRWRIKATVGNTTADININLGPGFGQRTINLRGLSASAVVDYDANTCAIDRRSSNSIDFDRFRRSRSVARQHAIQAWETLADYGLSKLKLRRRGNPYEVTFLESISSFYDGLRAGTGLDVRIAGQQGRDVMRVCSQIIDAAGVRPIEPINATRRALPANPPTVLVLGATGFIGRELVRQLIAANYSVRAMVRGSARVLDDIDSNRLEIVRGNISNAADLKAALAGIEFVYHLARADAKTWDDYVKRDVEPTRVVAEACLEGAVKRLVYTGTIDSYYAGANAGTITENTPLDRNIRRRNYYARAKAAGEEVLMNLHRTKSLPVVIFRPGIVIGRGGNPFHWGVGMFVSESVCRVWGDGTNKLPLVLVEDVAAALVRGIQVPGIEGKSYNLVDEPLLSAREYLDELKSHSRLALSTVYEPIWRFYAMDLVKWGVKVAVGHPDRIRVPSYQDWESRTQKAIFDCTRTRAELGWSPASDRQRMIDEGIGGSLQSWLANCK